MKSLIIVALLATSAPAFAADSASGNQAGASRDRRVCTRVDRRGGSRVAQQRVCLTASEWRERLGADWRQNLAGLRSYEEDMDAILTRNQRFETAQPILPN